MKTVVAVLVGVVIGALGAVLLGYGGRVSPSPSPGMSPPPPPPSPSDSPLPPAMCEGLVKLSVQDKTIVATPDTVCLAVGRPVTWEIVDKGTVTIDFEDVGGNKGPFPQEAGNMVNPRRGTYAAKNSGTVTSSVSIKSLGAEDLPRPWKYTVNWVLPTGEKLPELDPVVCIRR